MKKLLILATVLLVLLIAVPVNANSATLYVDDDGVCDGNTPCYNHPQDAVNDANPGDTILVYPGAYGSRRYTSPTPPHWSAPNDQWAPALIVYKASLTIQADDPNPANTVIQSTHDVWSNPVAVQASTGGTWNGSQYVGAGATGNASPNGVIVIADNVTIDGFTIISTYGGDAGAPGNNPNTAGVFVGGLHAGDADYSGIKGTRILNSIITGHSGVRLWKAPDTVLTDNTIDNNQPVVSPGTTPIGAGISVWDGWCDNPDFPPGWCEGPNVGSTGLQILNNNITTFYGAQGIAVGGYYLGAMDHSNLYIDGNTINSSGYGVTFWGSDGTSKVMTCNNTVNVPAGYQQVGVWWGSTYDGPFPDCQGPICSEVVADPNPVAVDTTVTLTANVDDSTTGGSNIGSAEYNIDGGGWNLMGAQDGAFDAVSEDVEASISAFIEAGVYDLCVRGTDEHGNIGPEECILLVVYDPEGGFVTGGGWIDSPQEAYAPDPSLTGKATFGFVSKYKKGAQTPEGQTEFVFKVADLNFHSTSYDWLVVAGARAKFKGTGTINGAGNYGFMLTAIDAELTPSTEVDRFRIKIWDKATDEVVYDNQMGDADDAEPTTEIGGGSIVIHTKKK